MKKVQQMAKKLHKEKTVIRGGISLITVKAYLPFTYKHIYHVLSAL